MEVIEIKTENTPILGCNDFFECSICDFNCACESDLVQHMNGHISQEYESRQEVVVNQIWLDTKSAYSTECGVNGKTEPPTNENLSSGKYKSYAKIDYGRNAKSSISNYSTDSDDSEYQKPYGDKGSSDSERKIWMNYNSDDDEGNVLKRGNENYIYSNKKDGTFYKKNIMDVCDIEKADSEHIKAIVKQSYKERIAKCKVTCMRCNEEFDNKSVYKDHLKKKENNCDEKQKLFKEEFSENYGVRIYFCLTCNKTYNHKNACMKHINSHHPKTKYHCDQCDFVCGRIFLPEHMRGVHGNEGSKCPKCYKNFANQVRLKRHMLNIHPSDPDKIKTSLCNICGKVYRTKKIAEHMLTHNQEKPFPCKLCKFSTVKKYNLDVHMRAHNKKGSNVYNRTNKIKNKAN